ncbi:rhamnogalacturonan acetylesterase [Paenibacillus sp. PDC88]|uniref:rhamnogalacturonan acetylesterase n=1 Tax=Paenibacillus sp. PDC88 TaxID=1884375 RepID=UPI00089AC4DF|nr:rhamnogalacturonan acetylesterase [Paenibacillus sp. PDC88]SDX17043.1 Lysophospholipase L1 [Paenibacillus sp. PDC88]
MSTSTLSHFKFDFGPGNTANGYIGIQPDTIYDEGLGYGFEPVGTIYGRDRAEARLAPTNQQSKVNGEGSGSVRKRLQDSFCIPLNTVFRLDVPAGSYRIHMLIGDELTETRTIIKAGEGRLILPEIQTPPGQWIEEKCTVHVREGDSLRLSFSGAAPRINAMEIMPANQTLTVFIAGDSTVCDQPAAGYPYSGWGQMLPACFKHDVVVDNHAHSGRSTKSFIDEGRLAAIEKRIKPGDYLFIQFGHNDEKSDAQRGTQPFTTYKEYLHQYIDTARRHEAHPVLITPVHRRYFNEDGSLIDTHGDYITAVKELAAEEEVPMIDLAARSRVLFEEAGVEASKHDFLWAFPGEYMNHPAGVEDNTHFSVRGATRLAKEVAAAISELQLQPLQMYLRGQINR